MQADTFWQIIEDARARSGGAADAKQVVEQATALLAARSLEEIIGFRVFLYGLQDVSYRWDLWGAADLINGGVSDDGFEYFGGWLVVQGQKIWDAALADPDSLADLAPEPDTAEASGMLYVALDAYIAKAGDDSGYWEDLPRRDPNRPTSPTGENFDFDGADAMRSRLPRLFALYRSPNN